MKVRHCFPVLSFLLLAACSKPSISVWSAYAEMEGICTRAAESLELQLEFLTIPGDFSPEVPPRETAEKSSDGKAQGSSPELIILDGTMLEAWAQSGMIAGLEEFFGDLPDSEPEGNLTPSEFGASIPVYKYEGRVYALFLNGGSGVLCYNKKAAESYLGHSDPVLVQKDLGDLNSFIVSSYRISVKSDGACAVLPTTVELYSAFVHTTTVPQQRGELAEDLRYRWFTDTVELFRNRHWNGLQDEEGTERELFSFVLSPLGSFKIPKVIKEADAELPVETPASDWEIIPGPDPWSRGGAWIVLHKDAGAKKKQAERIREFLAALMH
jgi:hypothetical protein